MGLSDGEESDKLGYFTGSERKYLLLTWNLNFTDQFLGPLFIYVTHSEVW